MSKEFIFKERNKVLEFVGNFEELYKDQEDPWHQSGCPSDMKEFYECSRKRLDDAILSINPKSLLEVGCGLGYTTQKIQNSLPNCQVTGIDISETAIKKAKEKFPNLRFITADIMSNSINIIGNYEIVVLNQILWYILESIDDVFLNCFKIIDQSGTIIISQGFMSNNQDQRYGRDICDGFDGLIIYLQNKMKDFYKIEHFDYNSSNKMRFSDGLIILKKL